MLVGTTMRAPDAISGGMGECYVTIENRRVKLIQLINVEVKFDKNKTKIPILGKTGKGNKATGWEGTGSATIHMNTSMFRELLYKYKETGQDIYFDMQVTVDDPTSSAGIQTTILKDCNLDGGILAKLDADADYLDEEISFTYEDFELPNKFKDLPGMV